MKVAVIGSGGREHALANQISKSKLLSDLYILPGNPGTGKLGKNIDISVEEHDEIVSFARDNDVDLIVIGPEVPLVDGLADKLRSSGVAVFGPNKNAAILEGSKKFSKEFMKRHNIPTAKYQVFSSADFEDALSYLKTTSYPTVIKASGLAAGKGVAICPDFKSAEDTLRNYFVSDIFGESGREVVIEDFLSGEEASIFIITDGKDFVVLPPSQDHKRVFDNDEGPNTGGMGAYAPAPIVTEYVLNKVEKMIIEPTLEGLRKENRTYNGCLYIGLMIENENPFVVEYNCRFGDPETQVVLPILDGDFLQLLHSTALGKIEKKSIESSNNSAVCVVEASAGYPGSYEKGKEIFGLDENYGEDVIIFHAGTKATGKKIVTSGGRVLGITAVSRDGLKYAKSRAYSIIDKVYFDDMHYRKDIADKAFK